jgi:hypothetical protein
MSEEITNNPALIKGGLYLISHCSTHDIFSLNGTALLKTLLFRKNERMLFVLHRYKMQKITFSSLCNDFNDLIASESLSLFSSLFSECSLQDGKHLSREERETKGLTTNSSYTYGEIDYKNFYLILRKLSPIKPGSIFYDLGSGTSRAVFASRILEDFSRCEGIEILENLHLAGEKIVKRYNESYKDLMRYKTFDDDENNDNNNGVKLVCGSFLDYDWSDGDIFFANSTCFDAKLMAELSEQANKIKPGSICITFTKGLQLKDKNTDIDTFEVLERLRYKMSWGPATVYIQRRLGHDGKPVNSKVDSTPLLDKWKYNASNSIPDKLCLNKYFNTDLFD